MPIWIFKLYASIVCAFLALTMSIIAMIGIWNIIATLVPNLTISGYEYSCHQSDKSYSDCYSRDNFYTSEQNKNSFPTGDELTNARKDSLTSKLLIEQRQGQRWLIKCLIILLGSLAVFIPHWRILRSCRPG